MKCPQCLKNHRRRRDGMSCSCGYPFVFDPQKNDKIRDYQMHKLVTTASANNTRFFTLPSLYGVFLCRPKMKIGCFIFALMLTLTIMGIPFFSFGLSGIKNGYGMSYFFIGFVLLVLIAIVYLCMSFAKPLTFAEFERHFQLWQHRSRLKSSHFIDQPRLHQPPPQWQESDIYNYGVEKIILLDNDLSVDLWVRNHEHINQKALILSSDGYPNYLIQYLSAILNNQPQIKIFSIHGLRTTLNRERMRFETATGINLDNYTLIELGFNNKQLQNSRRLKSVYRHLNGNIPLDMLPYVCGLNLLAWADQQHAAQHSLSPDNIDIALDVFLDDFDFG